jgi:hypothetical protein
VVARIATLVPLFSLFLVHIFIVTFVRSTIRLAYPPSLDPEE